MAHVLIASTNAAVVTGLEEQLRSHDFSVITSNDAETVMSRLSNKDATVAVIGEEIDCQPGFRVSTWVKDQGHGSAVIIMGEDDQPVAAIDALDAGADDYISNRTDLRELVCRIKALLRRF